MKIVTFYNNTRYAGGRSHRNINTLEFVEGKDIFQAAESYGYHVYPSQGEDFENGVNDWNANQVMDAEDFKKFSETNIGRLDLGETVFSSNELKEISVDEFKILPSYLQLEYINIWYQDVTEEMLKAVSKEDAFEFDLNNWKTVSEDLEKGGEDA